jgi:hypothetical protein
MFELCTSERWNEEVKGLGQRLANGAALTTRLRRSCDLRAVMLDLDAVTPKVTTCLQSA